MAERHPMDTRNSRNPASGPVHGLRLRGTDQQPAIINTRDQRRRDREKRIAAEAEARASVGIARYFSMFASVRAEILAQRARAGSNWRFLLNLGGGLVLYLVLMTALSDVRISSWLTW